jgi:hypothetical protein
MTPPPPTFAAAVALLAVAGTAGAQSSATPRSSSTSGSVSATATGSTGGSAQAAALQCGGVGQDDQDRIKAAAAKHGLLLTFASASGAYLADVDVRITRGDAVVVQGRCAGPLMLVDLKPAGSYEIRAVSQGREQRKTVTVGARPAQLTFTWPDS